MKIDIAKALQKSGVELRPAWARGGLVLAKGLSQHRLSQVKWPWHVAVDLKHEQEVYDAFAALPHSIRPRLKEGKGRVELTTTSSSSSTAPEPSESREVFHWGEVGVERTFIHCARPLSPRSNATI
mmetsp:Transcript_147905/g.261528  ORF Transcript_147905/g.261528 Transcript_147905/m.261528 type:complete len:126 (-) Transcript_147905:103-480(-)